MTERRYIGIDIGGTAVKTGLVDESGKVILKSETGIDVNHSGAAVTDRSCGERTDRSCDEGTDRSCKSEPVMETVVRSLRELASAGGFRLNELSGIGVSSPGSIDKIKGEVAISGGNVPGWGHTKIRQILEKEFKVPVAVANDGNCAVLAEAWVGAARDCEDVVCVTLGTGIGGGIISGGKLIEGSRGFAGEIGHFVTHAGGRKCECGGRGCFERYGSTSALVREGSALRDGWNSGRKIFEAANAGDEEAIALVDRWTDEVAYGVAGLVHIFNPRMVIIGGGVSAQEELVVFPVSRKVNSIIKPDFADDLVIRGAALGNDAGMVGAVRCLIAGGE